ncbi:S8 family peptidase [Nucisporomicrobium flavum]|uniref:S8 family peptidase n=1 Tax=Nucisporomicrobium flavum TaxID=2785915 RepID=UPI0018F56365|nr:S8 family peptidase [Nucisporomicrobium flavum]
MADLPDEACPNGESVGLLTLHPEWIAKSYFPDRLLEEFHLRAVGSRPVTITPEKWTKAGEPGPSPSNEIFIAGQREDFEEWAELLHAGAPPGPSGDQLTRVESLRFPDVTERLRLPPAGSNEDPDADSEFFEVVLHATDLPSSRHIVRGFVRYAAQLGVEADTQRALFAGGLCFMPVHAQREDLEQLALFSFLRVARPIPRLRIIQPIERSFGPPSKDECPLPDEDPVDPDLRIAVFDGGSSDKASVSRWTNRHETPGLGKAESDYVEHGNGVTSAVLFGPLEPGTPAPRPFGIVDHYRVLDGDVNQNPLELYDVLHRIESVLAQRRHQFVNFSLGPACPIEDDEVHPWTAVLDQFLSDGNTVATFAVGNTGELDIASGNARVQVPSDTVNGLAVGAADSSRPGWQRASYSSIGPGRRPGIVKPDLLAFGGCPREPFYVLSSQGSRPTPTGGTSFAAPAALRLAAGVRAHFGDRLSPLALKALLVHTTEQHTAGPAHVGWGRVAPSVRQIVECDDGVLRVVYQGELSPAQVLRAPIPLPDEELKGRTTITATICYATGVDPQDPGNYTRAGLEVFFRPNADNFEDGAAHPKTAAFFRSKDYETEQDQRRTAYKWETVLHRTQRHNGSSLVRPVFDIHYVAREGGTGYRISADRVRYALVITVQNRNETDIYDRVLQAYATYLEAIEPIVEVPIRIR